MADDTMSVQALLGKSADADFLREMIGFAAQRLMDQFGIGLAPTASAFCIDQLDALTLVVNCWLPLKITKKAEVMPAKIIKQSLSVGFIAIMLSLFTTQASAAASRDATEAALSRCLDNPTNASTAGQTDCQATAMQDYDRRLNAAYATLMRKLPIPAARRMRASQRAWLLFRDNEAAAREALYETRRGTMFVPMQAAAATIIVRDRAIQLEALVRVMGIE